MGSKFCYHHKRHINPTSKRVEGRKHGIIHGLDEAMYVTLNRLHPSVRAD